MKAKSATGRAPVGRPRKTARAATATARSKTAARSKTPGKRTGRRSAGDPTRAAAFAPKSLQHVRKWFQVQRPPAPGITFSVRMWVPMERLTCDEKKLLLPPLPAPAEEPTTTLLAASEVDPPSLPMEEEEEAFAAMPFDFEADAQFELSTAPGDDLFAPPPLDVAGTGERPLKKARAEEEFPLC